jgi:formylglycine-generating enzyme required for sulfatase activity
MLMLSPSLALANNLTISNVTLGTRDASANTVIVKFNVSWENSWRTKINHDAVWLTVRLNDPNATPANKKLCAMSAAGVSPTGFSAGTQTGLEFYVPADRAGAFLRRSENASVGAISSQNAQMVIDYASCGFSTADQIKASVFGLEMVFVPQGSFYAGDNATSAASFDQGSADAEPWPVSSESALSVSNPASDGYRYVSGGNAGENATGSSFTVPASFPKGYQSFYVMKYELTEGQWVEFINSLPSAARLNHDLTNNAHKVSDAVLSRNAIACSGSPLSCSSDRPWRAVSYLSWMDLAAFLDWNALRPATELEFEKIGRGPLLPINGEYAWGSTDITAADAISGTQEDGTETVTTSGANAHYNDTTLSGGDAGLGAEYQKGPLRVGILSTDTTTRITAGAGYYGVLDLSGNLKEHVVTLGNAAGRNFTGEHGDGVLSTDSGYEGNANETAWPGLDAVTSRGVTGADGSGLRGGSWNDAADRLRISDRFEAAVTSTQALNTYGGRGARTYDGN